MINRYKEEYFAKGIKNDYDECRFAKDKVAYAKQWIMDNDPLHGKICVDEPKNIVDRFAVEKIETIKNPNSFQALLKRMWCDKIAVYTCLKDIGLNEITIPYVYMEYTNTFSEKILDMLDTQNDGPYIIKTNHGSGWNIRYIPNVTNRKNVMDCVNTWLKMNYAYVSGLEEQYHWVKPGIIVQKLLSPNLLLDWSFWCEDGKIQGVGLTKKTGKNFEEYIAFVDENGSKNNWYIGNENEQDNLNAKQKEALNVLKPYVLKIASLFKLVRVDMYYVNGKAYFGETTFTPCSGILCYTELSNEND